VDLQEQKKKKRNDSDQRSITMHLVSSCMSYNHAYARDLHVFYIY
jgi:hypothetical protein